MFYADFGPHPKESEYGFPCSSSMKPLQFIMPDGATMSIKDRVRPCTCLNLTCSLPLAVHNRRRHSTDSGGQFALFLCELTRSVGVVCSSTSAKTKTRLHTLIRFAAHTHRMADAKKAVASYVDRLNATQFRSLNQPRVSSESRDSSA